jgi:hypothetical protein
VQKTGWEELSVRDVLFVTWREEFPCTLKGNRTATVPLTFPG